MENLYTGGFAQKNMVITIQYVDEIRKFDNQLYIAIWIVDVDQFDNIALGKINSDSLRMSVWQLNFVSSNFVCFGITYSIELLMGISTANKKKTLINV